MKYIQTGKILILLGIGLIITGIILLFSGKIPFLGRLPGDLSWRTGNFRIYFPIATMLLISLLLTIIINLFRGGK
ncbi:MAG: DUF2905 domain-containing protein [Candidatus Zixiibacteriota bacterium]